MINLYTLTVLITSIRLHLALERIVASKLIEELDQRVGFLDLSSISQDLDCEVGLVESVLKKLQKIEPAGLFSKILRSA